MGFREQRPGLDRVALLREEEAHLAQELGQIRFVGRRMAAPEIERPAIHRLGRVLHGLHLVEGAGPKRLSANSSESAPGTRSRIRSASVRHDKHLHNWLDMAERIAFQGLPARICWVGLGDRHRSASLSTTW